MKLAIIGYGKMGKAVEQAARAKGYEVGLIIDLDNHDQLNPANLKGHDAAIEFTTPGSAYGNISTCLEAGIPVVSGTTGWTDRLDEIRQQCLAEQKCMMYASNFSLGVNLLFYLNRKLASLMNRMEQYDVSIREVHHTMKKDAPSGTAISLADDIIEKVDRKKQWALLGEEAEQEVRTAGQSIPVNAIRADEIFGIHEVSWTSQHDLLSLKHSAQSREGFAGGALMAADFIKGKTGFYTMQDLLDI